jgi:glycosyltransferase involved in cell wall biosynthesis
MTILMAVRHWPDIAHRAVESIRKFTDVSIIMVDDASPHPDSLEGYKKVAMSFEGVRLFRFNEHMQHGFTLDFAIRQAESQWVITCDHDMIINSEKAFDILLDRVDDHVGVIGKMHSNKAGYYVHPSWAAWNASAIKKYHLSFAGFGIKGKGPEWDFATGQFLCYRLEGLGLGSGDRNASQRPFEIVPVDLGDTVTHAQVWRERGDTWRDSVSLC